MMMRAPSKTVTPAACAGVPRSTSRRGTEEEMRGDEEHAEALLTDAY